MSDYIVNGKVTDVIDGDTVDIECELPFNISFSCTARLIGVDTAEIHGVSNSSEEYEKGVKQTKFVEQWIEEHHHEDAPLEFTVYEKGKFGRWLVEVWGNGECLNEVLLDTFDVRY
jgi:endonuclease YncB( thermonuclease family)